MIENAARGGADHAALTPAQLDRFWAKVKKSTTPGKCWEWQRARMFGTHGYGQLGLNGRTEYAHRISYLIHFGPIPHGLRVLHSCDNPPCVNPAHLSAGTAGENSRDMREKDRWGNRVFRGAQNGSSKLEEADVTAIRSMAGMVRQVDIAELFGITQAAVSSIVRRQTWRHVCLPALAQFAEASEA